MRRGSGEPAWLTRRAFLRASGCTLILSVASACAPRVETPGATPARASSTEESVHEARVPDEDWLQTAAITPVAAFYEQHAFAVPTLATASWTLEVDGLVSNPLRLTYRDLLAEPQVETMRTLECIGNPVGGNQIGNAIWRGVAVAPILKRAGPKAGAVRAILRAADGYETSVPLEQLMNAASFFAHTTNGAPLTPEHGYPLRVFFPGLYGQKMPKWITGITLSDDSKHRGYWETLGWSDAAVVRTNSQIQRPEQTTRIPLGPIIVDGIAYAGSRRINRVEVGIALPGGIASWQRAETFSAAPDEVWTQFRYIWRPEHAGAFTLLVRAEDETGFVQAGRDRGMLSGSYPAGTSSVHSIVVTVA